MDSGTVMNPTLEIIALIFKSKTYLDFICKQLKSEWNQVPSWDISIRLVANDATPEILATLPNCGVPFDIYNDPLPNDYYLNRVYRCWNHAGKTSKADHICFVNSDMAFSPNWLANLLKHHDGSNIPCSRLIESGKMPSGLHGVSQNFGRNPIEFNETAWLQYVPTMSKNELHAGGLYMPVVFEKNRFIQSGMYPEGNIYTTGIGKFGAPFLRSGDEYFFNAILNRNYSMRHVTVFDSLVYHIQEGERDAD